MYVAMKVSAEFVQTFLGKEFCFYFVQLYWRLEIFNVNGLASGAN